MRKDKKVLLNALSDDELARVVGTKMGWEEELERCKADCEKRLANVAEIYKRKCITNCIERYKEEAS